MGEFCKRLFASDLMPHGVCWSWEPWVVWTNVVPDAVIALSYLVLSLTLVHLICRRRELAFNHARFSEEPASLDTLPDWAKETRRPPTFFGAPAPPP